MAKTTKTVALACPLCGSSEGTLNLDINSPENLECGQCSESFTITHAVELATKALARWEALADWIGNIPTD
jgi:hypothetical protein